MKETRLRMGLTDSRQWNRGLLMGRLAHELTA
jgi:hypothetical protein